MKTASTATMIGLFCLAAFSTIVHFAYINSPITPGINLPTLLSRHTDIVQFNAIIPYRFRLLSDFILEGMVRLFGSFEFSIYFFRLLQNIAIFLLGYKFYSHWLSDKKGQMVGLIFLTIGLCASYYYSDLSFYTYSELIFFLIAALLIQRGEYSAIIPLSILAALNRESSIFIPVLLFVSAIVNRDRRAFIYSIVSLVVFISVYSLIVISIGLAYYSSSRYGTVLPSFDLLFLNLQNYRAWIGLAVMYNVVPLALVRFSRVSQLHKLQVAFFAMPWFFAQYFFGSADEIRLFLVPLVIILIPAWLANSQDKSPALSPIVNKPPSTLINNFEGS